MVPGVYNYPSQYKGDTLEQVKFTIKEKETELPIDLTGATLKCQFRTIFNGAIVKEITDGSGITFSNPSGGEFIIDAFIVDWDPGNYLYDVEVTFANGTVKTYVKGGINVISDTTL